MLTNILWIIFSTFLSPSAESGSVRVVNCNGQIVGSVCGGKLRSPAYVLSLKKNVTNHWLDRIDAGGALTFMLGMLETLGSVTPGSLVVSFLSHVA